MANEKGRPPEGSEVVRDDGKGSVSDLWKKEDYWAIWLGFFVLIVSLIMFLPAKPKGLDETIAKANTIMDAEAKKAPFKTIAWHKAESSKHKLKATNAPFAKSIKKYTAAPHGWSGNPLDAFFMSQSGAEVKNAKNAAKYESSKEATKTALAEAQAREDAAAAAGFKDEKLNAEAKAAIGAWMIAKAKEAGAKKKVSAKPYNQIFYLIGFAVILAVFFGIGMAVMGNSFGQFFKGFLFVFLMAVLAYVFSSQATMKAYGIGYAAWAIVIGLVISNTIGTPEWVKPAVQTEYYIKTGLVLLGAEILFGKIVAIGIPGIFVAWVVTPIVLVTTYLFGQRILKIPSKTLNITISSDMSVCGVSAAIATASACRAKKEELTLAVGLSMIFTSVMMVVMPAFIKATGMPLVLGGAWMGGTIDATGAVAAAGAFLGPEALYTAATIKMIQNVLIGVIAFFVAVYWCAKVDCVPGQRVSIMEIWYRFPKFVLGFIAASIIFSMIYAALGSDVAYSVLDHGAIRGLPKILRGWFFCLAFTSIGLATNFRELKSYFKGGKPLILYVCGQSFNLLLTLTMAYIMFYLVFPDITAKI